GSDRRFNPSNLTDGAGETYWTTDDGITSAAFEIDLGELEDRTYLILQEYIKLGQRVSAFRGEYREAGAWKPRAAATTIGYKRILRFDPVTTRALRVTITAAKACPVISNVEVY